jgi:hypothetical protein
MEGGIPQQPPNWTTKEGNRGVGSHEEGRPATYLGLKGRFKAPPPKKAALKASALAGRPNLSTTGAGFTKLTPPGIRKVAPTLIAEKPTSPQELDPMLATMQNLATTLGSLNTQMQDMRHVIKDLQQAPPPTTTYVKPEAPPPELRPIRMAGPFYAVAYGRNGYQGVHGSWSKCAGWVTGVPGNVFQKFATLEAATKFVEQYNVGRLDRSRDATGGNLFREGPGGIGNNPMNSSGPYAQGEQAFDKCLSCQENKTEISPPLTFFGPDRSVKKEKNFYGFDLTTEWDVSKILLPAGMDMGLLGKGITQAITDVVSLPGAYQSNVGNDGERFALFTQSMAEMAHGSKSEMELFG